MIPSVSTRYIALLGQPLGFSKASAMQNAALRAYDMDALYFPLECSTDDLPVLLPALRRMPFLGLAVTKPLKMRIVPYLDEIDPAAARIGSCNTVRFQDGRLIGFNTDGLGFADMLRAHYGSFQNKNLLVCGAGGTARALCFACAAEGIGRIRVANRSFDHAQELTSALSKTGVQAEALTLANVPDALADTDILVNATGLGMQPHEGESPIPAGVLSSHLFVCDLAYNPPRPRLLEDAAQAGCRILNGFDMSVYQGARQFHLLTGKIPPLDVMFDVMRQQLP